MQKQTYWPLTKFPWLTNSQVKALEDATAWLTGMEKMQTQAKLYQQVVAMKKEQEHSENRFAAENESFYRSLDEKDPKQQNYIQSNVRLEQLADLTKDKFWLASNTDTQTVIKWLMNYTEDNWLSLDSLNNYLENWDETFLYSAWLKTRTNAAQWQWLSNWDEEWKANWLLQFGKNVVWGLVDSFSKDFAKLWVNATAWWMKKLWMDEEEVNKRKENAMSKLDKVYDVGQDKDSMAYKATNFAGDVWQMLLWEWEIKAWLKALPFAERAIKTAWSVENFVKQFPVLWKALNFTAKKWTQWVADTIIYNAVNWEWTSKWEMAEWGVINTIFWLWGKLVPSNQTVQNFAKKLQVWWLVNTKTLEKVNNALREAWEDSIPDVKAAGDWMLKREMEWGKTVLRKKLNEWRKIFRQAKNEILDQTNTQVESESAKQAIDWLINAYKWKVWWEKYVKDLELIKTKDKFTARELDNIKTAIDDAWLHIYDAAGNTADKLTADLWNNIRLDIKKQIEDIAEKEWLWDIAAINKEIQISKSLEEWIYWKETAEEAGNWITKVNPYYLVNTALWMIWDTEKSTTVASLLAKWTKMPKKDISTMLWENWVFSEDLLKKMFKNKEWAFKSFVNDLEEIYPSIKKFTRRNENTSLATKSTELSTWKKPATKKTEAPKKDKKKSNLWIKRKTALVWTEELLDNKKES